MQSRGLFWKPTVGSVLSVHRSTLESRQDRSDQTKKFWRSSEKVERSFRGRKAVGDHPGRPWWRRTCLQEETVCTVLHKRATYAQAHFRKADRRGKLYHSAGACVPIGSKSVYPNVECSNDAQRHLWHEFDLVNGIKLVSLVITGNTMAMSYEKAMALCVKWPSLLVEPRTLL